MWHASLYRAAALSESGGDVCSYKVLGSSGSELARENDHSACQWPAVRLYQFEQKLRGGSYKHAAKHSRAWHHVIQHLH